MKVLSPSVLDEAVRCLVAELRPEQIILFGSHAWGTPHEDSDLDLFVIVPDDGSRAADRSLRARLCLQGLDVPKDVIVRTRTAVDRIKHVRGSLESEILERGKVLYG